MRKHWVALLSLLGLAGSTVPVDAQILKGDQAKPNQAPAKSTNEKSHTAATNQQKLQVKQQPIRQQNQAAGTAGQTKAAINTGTCAQKGKAALTPPPPGQAQGVNTSVTRGKNNAAITKGNQQLTKGNQALTKGNQGLTKGNQALTKGNQQLTKASPK